MNQEDATELASKILRDCLKNDEKLIRIIEKSTCSFVILKISKKTEIPTEINKKKNYETHNFEIVRQDGSKHVSSIRLLLEFMILTIKMIISLINTMLEFSIK